MTSVLQELINEYSKKCRESCSGFPLIVIATTNMIDKITEGMRACFNHSFILDVYFFHSTDFFCFSHHQKKNGIQSYKIY